MEGKNKKKWHVHIYLSHSIEENLDVGKGSHRDAFEVKRSSTRVEEKRQKKRDTAMNMDSQGH